MNRILSYSLLAAFLLIISIPLIDLTFSLHLDTTSDTEKRHLARKPSFRLDSISYFPSRYNAYFNDNFPFRRFLIKTQSLWSSEMFHLSPVADVLLGKEGWLYFEPAVEDIKGMYELPVSKLEAIRLSLERSKHILDSLGIKFIVLIAPDKHSIYPEYLPDMVRRRGPFPGRLDQLMMHLRKHSSLSLLDVRDNLRGRKENSAYPMYMKTDTHWNDYGAFIAYQQLMKELSIPPITEEDLEWRSVTGIGGDLAGELSLSGRALEPYRVTAKPQYFSSVITKMSDYDYGIDLKGKKMSLHFIKANSQKLVLFGDSFAEALLKFLPYHFKETILIENYQFIPAIGLEEKPDVVICEVVERNIESLDSGHR